MRAYALLATIALSACQQKAEQHGSNRLPSATEVFDLRSKCNALGEKIMEQNFIGSALAQEQLSRYNPETNRCYVKLEVHTADLNTPLERISREAFLFDGQTGEMLATTSWKGGKKWGNIFSDSLRKFAKDPAMPTYDETDAMIDKFMAEDREP